MKRIKVPQPLVGLFPVPVVLVTSADRRGKPNVMTAGWVGVACSDPPAVSLAIRPGRYTHGLIGAVEGSNPLDRL